MYVTLEGGKKASMPRYYKERIFDHLDRTRQKVYYAAKAETVQEKWNSHSVDKKRDIIESDKAKFTRMKKSSTKNDKL